MITLWQAKDPTHAVPFDRKRIIGLHHLALNLDNADELHGLHKRLEGYTGVDIEFAPEPLGDSATQHMMCSIPGGIRMEFIAATA